MASLETTERTTERTGRDRVRVPHAQRASGTLTAQFSSRDYSLTQSPARSASARCPGKSQSRAAESSRAGRACLLRASALRGPVANSGRLRQGRDSSNPRLEAIEDGSEEERQAAAQALDKIENQGDASKQTHALGLGALAFLRRQGRLDLAKRIVQVHPGCRILHFRERCLDPLREVFERLPGDGA
jgi:hypothetical protein